MHLFLPNHKFIAIFYVIRTRKFTWVNMNANSRRQYIVKRRIKISRCALVQKPGAASVACGADTPDRPEAGAVCRVCRTVTA